MEPRRKNKISVLIPSFNSEFTICRAVDSVLQGKEMPCEILIYDDCSNVESRKVLENIESTKHLVKVFYGDVNRGAGYARKFLIDKSSGDYIAFLDADDWWSSNKISTITDVIEKENPDVISSWYEIIGHNGKKIGVRRLPERITFFKMHFSNWLPMSMTVVRSTLAGVDEMPLIRRRQDYGYWFNIFKKNKGLKCWVIADVLGGYTRQNDSLSSNPAKNILSNYLMFRQVVGYNVFYSIFFVLCNALVRVCRV